MYDGRDPVCEFNGAGQLTALNTFGAMGLASRSAGGASTFYAFDERGNVAQRLSGAGQVVSADLSDAYGKLLAGGSAADPWGFGAQAGYYADKETGLSLLTHRFYDPQQGRFLTRDPIGYDGGINLYGYTANNPVNEMDPSGLIVFPVTAGAIFAFAGATEEAGVVADATGVGLPVGLVFAGVGAVAALAGAGIYLAEKKPLPPFMNDPNPNTNPLSGKAPEDVVPGKEIPPDWKTSPGRDPGTERYTPPGRSGPQVLKEPGNPSHPDPIHQGPYCRISPGNGPTFRIPLKGNPFLQP